MVGSCCLVRRLKLEQTVSFDRTDIKFCDNQVGLRALRLKHVDGESFSSWVLSIMLESNNDYFFLVKKI